MDAEGTPSRSILLSTPFAGGSSFARPAPTRWVWLFPLRRMDRGNEPLQPRLIQIEQPRGRGDPLGPDAPAYFPSSAAGSQVASDGSSITVSSISRPNST